MRLPLFSQRLTRYLVLQHRDVYDAIRQHQPETAFLAMRKLLRNSKGDVFDAIWMNRNEREPVS